MDLLEIDAASNRGIDAIRDLRERHQLRPDRPQAQGLHPRRGPPDHEGRLERPPEVARGAARLRGVHVRLDPPPGVPAGHPVPPPTVRRPTAHDRRDRGQAARILEADGRTATPEAVHLIARLAAGGMRDAESMLDQLLSSPPTGSTRRASATCSALPTPRRSAASSMLSSRRDARAGMRLLDGLDERGRDLRGFLDQVIESLRSRSSARRLRRDGRRRPGTTPWRTSPRRLAGSRPSTRAAPASAACGSSSSSPCSRIRASRRASAAAAPTSEADREPPPPPADPPVPRPPRPGRRVARRSGTAPARPERRPRRPSRRARRGPGRAGQPPAPKRTPAPVAAASGSRTQPPSRDRARGRRRPRPCSALWPEIVARISPHPPTKPLIVACRPISVEDGVVTLGFPEDKSFLRAVAERRRTVLEEDVWRSWAARSRSAASRRTSISCRTASRRGGAWSWRRLVASSRRRARPRRSQLSVVVAAPDRHHADSNRP